MIHRARALARWTSQVVVPLALMYAIGVATGVVWTLYLG